MFRQSWSVKQKLRILNETDGMTLQASSDLFGISVSMLSKWRVAREKLGDRLRGTSGKTPHHLKGAGRPCLISVEIERELLLYLDAERANTNRVDVPALLVKLRQIDPSVDHQIDISDGSLAVRAKFRKQIWRILRKNNIGIRRTTHQAQNTRFSETVIEGYNEYLKEKMQMLMIDHDSVANFDETNVYFTPSSTTTLDRRGNRTVAVSSSKSSKRCTVMLGVTGNGKPFPPYIIFNGKYGPTGQICNLFRRIYNMQVLMRNNPDQLPGNVFGNYPLRCYFSVQEKAWMDSDHMLEWIEQVWKPWTNTKNGPTMLILDEFAGHMTAAVREAIRLCGTHLEFIPGGYTSKLQVMDVGFNKPFKDKFRHNFDNYNRTHGVAPKREDVATWIQLSWEGLSFERIATNTWRRVGLPQPIIEERVNENIMIEEEEEEQEEEEEEQEEEINVDEVVDDALLQQELDDLWMYDDTGDTFGNRIVTDEF